LPGFGPRRTQWFDPDDPRLTDSHLSADDPNPAPNKGDIT
jgi:hypothetical protein